MSQDQFREGPSRAVVETDSEILVRASVNSLASQVVREGSGRPSSRMFEKSRAAARLASGFLPGLRAHLLATTALALTGLPTAAQTTNFIPTSSGSWFAAANWSAGVPRAGTQQTNVSSGGTALISGAPAFGGSSLLISNGSTVTIQPGGSLTMSLNGLITLNGGTLRSTTDATFDNVQFVLGSSSTFSAAAGQSLTLGVGGGPPTSAVWICVGVAA